MRLLSCHIENFGKLSNWDCEFKNGCNLICRDNGWGKSTLAAFIRVMLYGFANQTKRSELENERRRYKPWQGGAYGGSLTFEAKGKTYLCHRLFGEKEKDDVFELRDAVTNLKTTDFSERLGEELFQLDQDSFDRSICITQSNADIRFVQTTGSMNAKLGNLVEDTEDINNFEKVNEKLTNLLNAMSPKRRTGSLYKRKENIEELRFQVRRRPEMERTIAELKAKRSQKVIEREALLKERERTGEKQRRLVFVEKRKHYQRLCEDFQKRQEDYEEVRSCFPADLPDVQELEQKTRIAGSMDENYSAMNIYALSKEEDAAWETHRRRFGLEVPRQATIEQMQELAQKWRENDRQLREYRLSEKDEQTLLDLQKQFQTAIPTDEELETYSRNWELRSRKQEALSTKEANLDMAKLVARQSMEPKKKTGKVPVVGILLLILAGLFVAGGIYLLLNYQVIGIGGLLLGLACAVAGIVFGMPGMGKKARTKRQEQEEEAVKAAEAVSSLEENIRQDTLFIQETEKAIREYLTGYGISWEEYAVPGELHRLKMEGHRYRELQEQKESYYRLRESCQNEEIEKTITEFLNLYYAPETVAAGEYSTLLQKLEGDRAEYTRLCEKWNHYLERKAAYDKQREELQIFLQELGVAEEKELSAQLFSMQQRLNLCIEREKACKEAARNRDDYWQKEGDEVLLPESDGEIEESADELRTIQSRLAEQIEMVQNSIRDYERQIDDCEDELEEIAGQEVQLEEQEEQYRIEKKKYQNLLATQKYLQQAKESLTEKYMQPLMSGVKKYYAMLTGQEAAGFRMDANANLTIEEQGLPRKPEFFSTGLRDLLGLCIRMALVDAMYQENLPFILLDDPFVNYDDRKRESGMKFLEKISEKYQIIYFSCREQTFYTNKEERQ